MKRAPQIIFIVFFIVSVLTLSAVHFGIERSSNENKVPTDFISMEAPSPTPTMQQIPESYFLKNGIYAGQSFNNCGPASLSMAMSFFGKNVTQADIASRLRPYNNPAGGVDDKAVLADELVQEAKANGLGAVALPNGNPDLVRRFLANDISVILRTWLNPDEDIGHYRVLTGYDMAQKNFYANDSYHGPNITLPEDSLLEMWQPFNYGYILVYPKEKELLVRDLIGEDTEVQKAWENSLKRAEQELSQDPNNAYALFNKSVALYHLGEYEEAVKAYEDSSSGLPPRMLWYQLEPIYAYQKTGQDDKALELSDRILSNGNAAYSELYQIKGEIYLARGEREQARREFEKAVLYNKNFAPARQALSEL